MKLDLIRTKASLLGVSGLLVIGASTGIGMAIHPVLAAPPAASVQDTGDAVEAADGPAGVDPAGPDQGPGGGGDTDVQSGDQSGPDGQ